MMEDIEKRLADLETRQRDFNEQLEAVQELIAKYKQHEIKPGSLAPLAKALAYHHKMVDGWDYLALEGHKLIEHERLYTQFVKMRDVVIHYEYVTQTLLGIQPSPFADLED